MERQSLLLLTGILCDATVWRHQIAGPRRYRGRLVVPTTGTSDTLPAMAVRGARYAPETFAVAGHSMGARVALEMFRLAPERITRIALLDTSVIPVAPDEPEKRAAAAEGRPRGGMEVLVRDWLPPMVWEAYHGDASIMEPMREMVRSMTPEIYRRPDQRHADPARGSLAAAEDRMPRARSVRPPRRLALARAARGMGI